MNFTSSQKTAIAYTTGHLQLIACAGSGKTEVVSRRVVTLLKPKEQGGGGCKPANIIAFTFTEKAAAELKARIHQRCHAEFGEVVGLAEMYVGTIHGYCLELLKTSVPEYMKYEVLNEVQQTLFVDRHSKASGLTQSTTLDGKPLKRYVDTAVYVQAMSVLREDVAENPVELADCSVAQKLPVYEGLLHQKGYLDYSAILKEAQRELATNARLREELGALVQHVIVDEYQDVNPVQESIVNHLHSLGADICVVGDDDQTIYQWRGSDVSGILGFEKRYKGVQRVRLEENFRSSEGIVAVAREFIKKVVTRLSKEMKPAADQPYEPGDIVALTFDEPVAEAQYIAETCKKLHGVAIKDGDQERGIAWSDMAVLLRTVRKSGGPIMDALKAAGVPYVITGMDNLFDKEESEAARQLFYFLAGEADEVNLRAAWTAAKLGIETTALDAAIAQASDARDKMKDAHAGQFNVYNLQRQFMGWLEAIDLREEKIPNQRGEVVFYNLGKFSQLISDFESIHFHSSPVEKYKSFAGFLQHQAEGAYPEGWQDNAYANPNAVRIMTVHQAKGLQWPVVFIPQLVKNRFPAKGSGGRTVWHLLPTTAFKNQERYRGGIEDERRLFYVAVTRAQKFLHVSSAPTPGNQLLKSKSDFYEDVIASKYVKRTVPDYSQRKRLPAQPRASVANVVLSFSDLKYFFECPYQFKLRILYGFNAPLHEALGFGKGLHDALAEVHKRALAGETIEPTETAQLVERHLRTPYAYQALREKLEAAAKKAIAGYIKKNAKQLNTLEFSEKTIEITLGDGVSVAGRIDLVKRLDTGEVTIVDLKSNERSQTEQVTETQLHIYALGYKELTGRNADYVEIYELDEQKQKVRSVQEEFIERVQKNVRQAADALRRNDLQPQPHQKSCGGCDYRRLCSSAAATN